jgi:UDP-N-acetylmuramoylalanine--D-glutamate ligase
MMQELKGNRALVVGLGHRTGLAACNFLARRGYAVAGNDIKTRDALSSVLEKMDSSVRVIAGTQSPDILSEGFDFLVLSPGVPRSIPLIREAEQKGIPVIAEIELAYRFMKGYIIGITGTDGKSTTTSLVGHVFAGLGLPTLVGGNIGIPLVSLVDKTADDAVSVIELSSFQLETIDSFRPHAAALLNITPDHLDRYSSINEYAAAKMRIAKNQTVDDAFVYYKDDARIGAVIDKVCAKRLSFSFESDDADALVRDGIIYVRWDGDVHRVCEANALKIAGRHNVLNAMAALLMVLPILRRMEKEINIYEIARLLCDFPGLPHRMETVGEYEGRTFINDSKATTVGAVEMALQNFSGNAVLILGGRTKGDDYSRLVGKLNGKLRALVLIGESKEDFAKIFAAYAPMCAESLEDAVRLAMRASRPGDAILLSPACASFDMFKSYEHRGEVFRSIFESLRKGELSWM